MVNVSFFKAGRVALLVCASALLLALASRPARATDFYYACGVLGPNSWCPSYEVHTFGYNASFQADYITINQCAKLTPPNNPDSYYARKCDYAQYVWVWSNGGGNAPYPNNSVSMRAHHANGNNGSNYAMRGYAQF